MSLPPHCQICIVFDLSLVPVCVCVGVWIPCSCVQAIIITHELLPPEQMDHYLVTKLHPVVPLLMYGRSAAAAPTCTRDVCLWYGWRDRIDCRYP